VDRLLATKSEGVGLIIHAITFQDFQPMWSQITNVTDRQTDGRTDRRTTCDRKTALCTMHSASRGKKFEFLKSQFMLVMSEQFTVTLEQSSKLLW